MFTQDMSITESKENSQVEMNFEGDGATVNGKGHLIWAQAQLQVQYPVSYVALLAEALLNEVCLLVLDSEPWDI